MQSVQARFIGVEIYFDDLERAKEFYEVTLGLTKSGEQTGHHAQFDFDGRFLCLERKGVESYPSKDKAVLLFEVPNIESAIAAIGRERFVHSESAWAVLHDPEGHNVLLMQSVARGTE